MIMNKISPWTCLALLIVLGSGTVGMAQVTGRNTVERTSNRAQIAQGKKMLERDQKELEAYKKKLVDLENAFANKDAQQLNALNSQLVGDMTREVGQSGEKAKQAQKELMASRSEVRSDRREVVGSRDDTYRGGYTTDDRNDLARDQVNRVDDRVDASRDKADLQAIVQRAQRQQQILASVQTAKFSFDNEAAAQASGSAINQYKEFAALMEQDFAQTKKEITEDRREAGEDRRETRDDVRESDELDNRARRRK